MQAGNSGGDPKAVADHPMSLHENPQLDCPQRWLWGSPRPGTFVYTLSSWTQVGLVNGGWVTALKWTA